MCNLCKDLRGIMSIYLTTGVATIHLQSYLNSSTDSYQKTMERLSSGCKFATVGDNPLGVTQTAVLASEISANAMAKSNTELGSDLLTIVEDNQGLVISDLQRIRDLCTQASSETYSSSDKDAIVEEIKQRLANIDSISESTKFNGISLLDGSSSDLTLQTGANETSTINIGSAMINVHVSQLGVGANQDLRLDDTVTGETWTSTDIKSYMDKIDSAITQLTGTAAQIGGFMNRLDAKIDTLTSMNTNLTENKSIISDTDVAEATADLVKYQILQEATVSILTQANQVPSMAIQLLE